MKKIKFGLQKFFPQRIGLVIDAPSPSSKHIPEWYRDGEKSLNQNGWANIANGEKALASMKSCNPFLDAISSGYMLTTWADLEIIENHNNKLRFKYLEKDKNGEYVDSAVDYEMVEAREGDAGYTIPRPAGYAYKHLVWRGKWGIETPKGWSVLVSHPMNQFQLPFMTTSGIIDSDRFMGNGNIPFFIKKDWTGIIPKGTPIAQLLPIKRSSWMSVNEELSDYADHLGKTARVEEPGFYRSKLWVPKKYR